MKERIRPVVFMKRYGRIIVGGGVLLILIMMAICAPLLTPYDPVQLSYYETKLFPCAEHPMGTDNYGRDVYAWVLYGARISLVVGFGVAAVSTVFGIVLGLLMGYYKKVDMILMRILEGVSAFPSMLLAMTFAAVFGTGVDKVVLSIALVSTPSVAKIVRAQTLSIKESEHIESSKAMGTPDLLIIFRDILPLCVSPLIIRFTGSMASAILTEASLSFLGVGISPTIPTWGNSLSTSKTYVITHPYMVIYPGLAIVVTVLCISIMGDGLRDVLDPKLR